jgi:ABC-2 type transport system permease protein
MIRLQLLDYLATLRERKTWLAAGMLAYAVLGLPVLFERPPEHIRQAITAWFGDEEPFTLLMYVWIDLAMNKIIAFLPVVLASGVVLRERDTGVLAVLAAKPVSMPRYFVLRAVSACAVMATLYVLAQLLGAAWFAARTEGFRVTTFLAAMSLHLFTAIFATAFAATVAVWVGKRGAAALVSLGVLGMLVGLALIGFYQPAWRSYAQLNPLTLGALSLGHLDALGPGVLLPPMLALAALSAVTIAAGALAARRLEA